MKPLAEMSDLELCDLIAIANGPWSGLLEDPVWELVKRVRTRIFEGEVVADETRNQTQEEHSSGTEEDPA